MESMGSDRYYFSFFFKTSVSVMCNAVVLCDEWALLKSSHLYGTPVFSSSIILEPQAHRQMCNTHYHARRVGTLSKCF